jgi:hypothetical protein
MPDDYNITGLKRVLSFLKAYATYFVPYLVPISMIAFEVLFILDMLSLPSGYWRNP